MQIIKICTLATSFSFQVTLIAKVQLRSSVNSTHLNSDITSAFVHFQKSKKKKALSHKNMFSFPGKEKGNFGIGFPQIFGQRTCELPANLAEKLSYVTTIYQEASSCVGGFQAT